MRAHHLIKGDALTALRSLSDSSIHCCVTSPPYWGLRDYGTDGQLGLEVTPDEYVSNMVAIFAEVRRVLRDDGTLWLNLGDSYAGSWGAQGRNGQMANRSVISARQIEQHPKKISNTGSIPKGSGLKPKDLVGIPWRAAFALQADGWYLRQDIIWHKPNPMPESVRDRCTKAHEYLFLLTKSPRYYYDHEAIKEPAAHAGRFLDYTGDQKSNKADPVKMRTRPQGRKITVGETRNRRSVWTVSTKPFKGAHFATFPPDLIEPCILAGCPEWGVVLDPFAGAGTAGLVAVRNNRLFTGIEINPEYVATADARIQKEGY